MASDLITTDLVALDADFDVTTVRSNTFEME